VAIAKANECIPYYTPGDTISAYVATAVTGKRFVKISANRQAGPALNTSTTGGNVTINHATAAGRVFGVAAPATARLGLDQTPWRLAVLRSQVTEASTVAK
jgi:hypothetical protein